MSKLSEYIELIDERNENSAVSIFMGLNRNKEFMPTVATTDGLDSKKYKIVRKNVFVFSGMQTGRDNVIRIGLSKFDEPFLISPAYTTFIVKNIIPEYFFMLFKSDEMDRYGSFLSDSSVRANLDWDRFLDIDIDVPPLEKQQQAVDVYLALVENQKKYEKGLDDLKLTCDAYIEELRRKLMPQEISKFIKQRNEKNKDSKITRVLGISKDGFIEPKQEPSDNISNYNKFYNKDFVYSPPRINVGSIGLYEQKKTSIASPIYVVFYCIDETKLNPKYLNIWLNRKEFFRSTDFYSIASVRNNFDYKLMSEVKISIPSICIQKSIADIYDVYNKRKQINEKLKQYISEICPILIRGSVNG